MPEFSEALLNQAKQLATNMLQSNESIRSLNVGEQQSALWVTTQKEQVVGSQSFTIDGTIFYVGIKVNS